MNTIQWIVSHGGDFTLWLLGTAGSWLLAVFAKHVTKHALVTRALAEIGAAVREVGQTFVDNLKAAAVDGKLTKAEARVAKNKAIEVAKANIGRKGLTRLARILGIDDVEKWIGTQVESAVAQHTTFTTSSPVLTSPPFSLSSEPPSITP